MSEILVVGGGPAGAAAARLLALWGHDVRLLCRHRSPGAPTLAESLPPSCGKLFDLLGVSAAVDAAGFVRSTGNTVWWGEQSTRVEMFAGRQQGWQITADALSSVLTRAARDAGARIEEKRVAAADLDAARESIILDCTGRSGVVARARGWRVYEPDLRTVAVVGVWRRHRGWPVPDPTHTLIESYPDGWMWSVPLSAGTRYIAAMVDPRTSNLAAAASREIYLNEIAKTERFAALIDGATLEQGPTGWDASMYWSTTYASDRELLVGDAASFIDPLSSAGVKKALASGWLAAITAHTVMVRPAMRRTAVEFFAAREGEMYDHFRALTHRFLTDAAAGHPHAFWSDRVGSLEAEATSDFAEEHAVQAAFERIRTASSLALRRGENVRIEPRPAVSGCEIVMEARIVRSASSAVRYRHDVDLIALLDLAPQFDDAGKLFEAYVRQHGPVTLPDFLAALSAAVANGWLTWRG
jgi:flavin-dependent dehydrogenase